LVLTKKILHKFLFVLLFLSANLRSQNLFFNDNRAGFNLSANLAFGTHFQRLGFNINFFFVSGFFQSNSEVRMYFNFKGPGPRGIYPELTVAQGILFGYGAQTDLFNPFFSSISNQTGFQSSAAYSYNAYFNRRLTTQQTGIFAFEFNRFSVISENDLFARPYFDRFRTAAFMLQYQYLDQFQAAINCTMWTGRMGQKRGIDNPIFNFRCYMDTTGATYGKTSNGLLSAQFKYNLGYYQNAQVNAGIDAEQVRNVMQNRFIHDMKFIPKRWNKAVNCHIPMLDENNEQFIYKEGQKIRKPKSYFNLYSNANVFY
jgi:hypothetical protein